MLATEIAEELNDSHNLGAFIVIVYKIPEQKNTPKLIRLHLVKDEHILLKMYTTGKGVCSSRLALIYPSAHIPSWPLQIGTGDYG